MDCKVLQLVIQSAHGLKYVNHITTMNPYALVSIRDNQNKLYSSEEKTPEHTGGGSNPTWNSPVTFNLDITKAKESSLELVVKLMSCRTGHLLKDKEIGEVRVFITKLLEGFGGEAKADAVVAEKQMSASVVTTDEKPQGTLVFSYKFESTTTVQKPTRQINLPTAPQNVQQNPEQPAGWVDQLISKTAKGIAGTALNTTGVTSGVASDAAARPRPLNSRKAAGTAPNTTGLTSVAASDAAALPPQLNSGKAEGVAGTALNTTGLTSVVPSDAAAPPPTLSPGTAEGIVGTPLNTTRFTSVADSAAAVDRSGADDPSANNNNEDHYDEDEDEDEDEDCDDE